MGKDVIVYTLKDLGVELGAVVTTAEGKFAWIFQCIGTGDLIIRVEKGTSQGEKISYGYLMEFNSERHETLSWEHRRILIPLPNSKPKKAIVVGGDGGVVLSIGEESVLGGWKLFFDGTAVTATKIE